jgi:hypothetical protein
MGWARRADALSTVSARNEQTLPYRVRRYETV